MAKKKKASKKRAAKKAKKGAAKKRSAPKKAQRARAVESAAFAAGPCPPGMVLRLVPVTVGGSIVWEERCVPE